MSSRIPLALFGRAPRPGATKTRLVPALGAQGAADLYAAFLVDSLARCYECADVVDVTLWVADEPDDPVLAALCADVPRRSQPAGGLGARMAFALGEALDVASRAMVVGSDLPTLPAAYLRAAAVALEVADVVLGPSADGGYYLVGARGRVPRIFDGIRWSTRHTLADTLEAADRSGLAVRLLPPWYDVDEPKDLRLLRAHLAITPDAAPATAHYLGF